jgi:predicted NUDIX family NTP pyrophosphohydrolase
MKKIHSAGIILLKKIDGSLKVLLGHVPGKSEPTLFDRKWTIPKGKVENGESFLSAAKREFKEESGLCLDNNFYIVGGTINNRPLFKTSYKIKENKETFLKILSVFLVYDFLGASDNFKFSSVLKEDGAPELDLFAWIEIEIAQDIVTRSQSGIFCELNKLKSIFKV